MTELILSYLSGFVISTISTLGYTGILLLMAIESACIPLPSEIILPFSGYLVWTGRFNIWGVALMGALGCNLGSIFAYYTGVYGGRSLLVKYGKYVLVSRRDVEMADRWFANYGPWTVFFGRLLPVIRTFIAFPAGVARMDFLKFNVYTFLGSFPWCLGLAYAGYETGAHWRTLGVYFHRFDTVISVLLVAATAAYVWRHWKHRNWEAEERSGNVASASPSSVQPPDGSKAP